MSPVVLFVDWNRRLQRGFGESWRSSEWKGEGVPEQQKPFHVLFQEHLAAGTDARQRGGDTRPPRWKNVLVADAVGCDPRTVTNWRNGSRTPLKAELDKIVALLFGDNPLHAAAKAEFINAWNVRDAQRGLPGRGAASRSAPGQARRGGQGSQTAPDWVPEEPSVLREGLGRLYVHHHKQGDNQGEAPGSVVALEVTAEAGRVYVRIPETDDTPRVDATFAVTAAEIVVVRELNVTPVPRTALGTPDSPHPNVTFVSSWQLKVPLANDGLPGGIVLAGDTLRLYATRDGLPYGIRIELRCRDIDLKPAGHPTLPDISEKQRAVLHRVLQRHDADPKSGILSLAGAELYRSADP